MLETKRQGRIRTAIARRAHRPRPRTSCWPGLFGALSPGEAWVGVGAGVTFIGVALVSPRLVGPLASLVGRPLERLRGVPGRLARENSVRNPGRTAATAAALMIGLALVSFVTVFAAGLKGSIDDAIDKTLSSDLLLANTDGFSDIPLASADAAGQIDGVAVASPLRYTQAQHRGGRRQLHDPRRAGDRAGGPQARLDRGRRRRRPQLRPRRRRDRREVRRRGEPRRRRHLRGHHGIRPADRIHGSRHVPGRRRLQRQLRRLRCERRRLRRGDECDQRLPAARAWSRHRCGARRPRRHDQGALPNRRGAEPGRAEGQRSRRS